VMPAVYMFARKTMRQMFARAKCLMYAGQNWCNTSCISQRMRVGSGAAHLWITSCALGEGSTWSHGDSKHVSEAVLCVKFQMPTSRREASTRVAEQMRVFLDAWS